MGVKFGIKTCTGCASPRKVEYYMLYNFLKWWVLTTDALERQPLGFKKGSFSSFLKTSKAKLYYHCKQEGFNELI